MQNLWNSKVWSPKRLRVYDYPQQERRCGSVSRGNREADVHKRTATLWCLCKHDTKKMQNPNVEYSKTDRFLRQSKIISHKKDWWVSTSVLRTHRKSKSLKCFTPIFSRLNLTCESFFALNQIVPAWVSQIKTHNSDRFISQYTDD